MIRRSSLRNFRQFQLESRFFSIFFQERETQNSREKDPSRDAPHDERQPARRPARRRLGVKFKIAVSELFFIFDFNALRSRGTPSVSGFPRPRRNFSKRIRSPLTPRRNTADRQRI